MALLGGVHHSVDLSERRHAPCAPVKLHTKRSRVMSTRPCQSSARRRYVVDLPQATSGLSVLHSTYPLMERRSAAGGGLGSSRGANAVGGAVSSRTWLSASVRHIVSTVGGPSTRGPLLQLVFSSGSQHRFETMPVSKSLADDPQSWSQLAATVQSSGANGLVLVRPIATPEQHCVFAARQASPLSPAASLAPASLQPPSSCGSACGGPPCSSASAGSSAASPSSPEARIDGTVGACCAGDEPAASEPRIPGVGGDDSQAGGGGGKTQYFGLVVQGSSPCEADGCWVLKTTRTDSGGVGGLCSCVHFCLTRVCHGQPLYEQLRAAWLVPQSA